MSMPMNCMAPIWATQAIVDELGQGTDGLDVVGLRLLGKRVIVPVNLPSEARQIGPFFGRQVTLALLAAPEPGARSLEEDIVLHRSEVVRLRDLLAAKPTGEAEARVEIGRRTVVITCRGEDAEHRAAQAAAEMMASEDTRRRLAEAEAKVKAAKKSEEDLYNLLRSVMWIVDAVTAAEVAGKIMVDSNSERWKILREMSQDPEFREWLFPSEKPATAPKQEGQVQ
jgi:hypothetical protein